MKKRTIFLITTLMLLCLWFLIWIQTYWIDTTMKEREIIFEQNVNMTLKNVADRLQEEELEDFLSKFSGFREAVLPKQSKVQIKYRKVNQESNEALMFQSESLKDEITLPLSLINRGAKDSIRISSYFDYSKTLKEPVISQDRNITNYTISFGEKETNNNLNLSAIRTSVSILGADTPIGERIEPDKLNRIIEEELKKNKIDAKYEFAVFCKNGHISDIQSENFDKNKNYYKTEILPTQNNQTKYELYLMFPKQRFFLSKTLMPMMLASFVFVILIVLTFGLTFFYLVKQKRLADMKNDFVNNITHEFKTPIATIGIAADAIKSPHIIHSEDKIKHYLSIIKEENKRMLRQVENVLRIAKLERHGLLMDKKEENLNELLKEALEQIELLVQDREGEISEFIDNKPAIANVDRFHLTNVFLNILDNANKYSPNKPIITVKSEIKDGFWILTISDKGIGMKEKELKKAFEKFYRAETGNIHNIKGHGLGLAYSQKIIELHSGSISAVSEPGKGSTFTIKIPII